MTPDPRLMCLCNHPLLSHDVVDEHCRECTCTRFEEDPTYEPTPLLSDQIQDLRDLREKIAALTQTLAERELTGRVLRLGIETELQAGGKTKTDSDKLAKADERYLSHERRSIQLTFDHAVAEAHAESLRFQVQLQLAVLQRTGVGA